MFKDRAVKIIRSIKVGRVSKIILLLIFCISILGIFGQTKADTISDKQAELDSLQSQINQYSSIIAQKQKEAGSLQAQIDAIDASLEKTKLEIQRTQTNIDKNQLEIDDTQAKINDKQKEMDKKKGILRACIQTTYEEGKQSTLEILVSSDSLSDFMDQMEYISVVEDKTKGIYDEVKSIKDQLTKYRKDLENKRQELVKLNNQQDQEKQSLEGQVAAKQNLLAQTEQERASYEGQLADASNKANSVRSAIDLATGNRDVIGRGGRYDGGGNLVITNSSPYHYYQWDSRWGGLTIGSSNSLVRDYGCALTSVAMVATSKGRGRSPGALARYSPAFWGDLIIWGAAGQFCGMGYVGSGAGIDNELAMGNPVIVFINIGHYVVISGRSGNTYYVDDPYFSGGSYSMSQVQQVVVYR